MKEEINIIPQETNYRFKDFNGKTLIIQDDEIISSQKGDTSFLYVDIECIIENLDKIFINNHLWSLKDDNIIIKTNKDQFNMEITSLALQGKHNVKNSMAAAMTAQLLKVRKETIRESLEDFEGAEHRLEKVLKTPLTLAAPKAWLIALIKPQFQVGRQHLYLLLSYSQLLGIYQDIVC